jgi:hypothetical protein
MQMTNSIEIGNMQWIPNYALSFDGVDDYVDISSSELDITSDFTIEANIYIDNLTETYCSIIARRNSSEYQYQFRLFDTGSGYVLSLLTSGGCVNANTILNAGQWYHVVVTYDVDGNTTFYIDGNSDGSATSLSISSKNVGTYIGKQGGDMHYFSGAIDEIRIWNDLRTQTEIENNMNKELNGNETELIAYYKMNTGSGSIAYDDAGNNDGTIIGATWQEVE